MILRTRPLTRSAFAPFGQVLDYQPGDPLRRNYLADLVNDRTSARPNLRVQRTEPTDLPITARIIERHPHSSQTFAPISGGPFLVVVFPSGVDGQPLIESGNAFIAAGDQAVNYNRGTWHHGFVALQLPGTFLMLRWEDGTSADEEFRTLPVPIQIE